MTTSGNLASRWAAWPSDTSHGISRISVNPSLDPNPHPESDNSLANVAADYVAAAGGPTNILTTPPTGWSYLGSDAANGGTEFDLSAGAVGISEEVRIKDS